MAEETLGFKVAINGIEGTITNLKELKNSIKAATEAQASAALKYGEGSAKYKEASKTIAELKSKMEDLGQTTRNVSGSGVERLSSSFGTMKEGMEKADFGKFKAGLSGIGAAMKAIPVFLIVEGIMKLIESFDELKESGGIIGKVFSKIGEAIDWASDKLEEFSDWITNVDTDAKRLAENQIESAKKTQAAIGERYDEEIKKAAAAGKNTLQLEVEKTRAVRKSIDDQIDMLNKLALIKDGLNKEERTQLEELTKKKKESIVEEEALRNKQYKEIVDKQIKHNEEIAAKNKEASDKKKKDLEDSKKLFEQALAEEEQKQDNRNAAEKKESDDLKARRAKDLEDLKALQLKADQDEVSAFIAKEAELKAAKDKALAEELALKQAKLQTEFALETQSVQALQSISDAFYAIKFANTKNLTADQEKHAKKQFQINKALSIASTVVAGYQGVVNALSAKSALPEPFGQIMKVANAVSTGLATAANVAKISATQFNTAGFASSIEPPKEVGTAAGNIGSNVNTSPPTVTAPNNNASTSFNSQGQNMTIRAELVETQSRSVTERIDKLNRQAEY